jgi:hypothetical protein
VIDVMVVTSKSLGKSSSRLVAAVGEEFLVRVMLRLFNELTVNEVELSWKVAA